MGISPVFRSTGMKLLYLILILHGLLWTVCLVLSDLSATKPMLIFGEFLGSTVLLLMVWVLLLTTRLQRLEEWFQGLDKMYLSHRYLAILVVLLVQIHTVVLAQSVEQNTLAKSLGGLGADIMLYGTIWTLLPRIRVWGVQALRWCSFGRWIPAQNRTLKGRLAQAVQNSVRNIFKNVFGHYDLWKFFHRFMGGAFVLAAFHVIGMNSFLRNHQVLFGSSCLWIVIGVGAYLYTEFLLPQRSISCEGVIHKITQLQPQVVQFTVAAVPSQKLPDRECGQFVNIRFPEVKGLHCFHPFTMSGSPLSHELRFTVKMCGDFTRRLAAVSAGNEVVLSKPYGRFILNKGKGPQVWVAGGIGITPFLSWLYCLPHMAGQVYLFYSCRNADDFVHQQELLSAQSQYPHFYVDYRITSQEGRYSAQEIRQQAAVDAATDFYMCGPLQMIQSLQTELVQTGIKRAQIHFEEFSFR